MAIKKTSSKRKRGVRTFRCVWSGCLTSLSFGSEGNSKENTNVPAGNLPGKGCSPAADAVDLGSPFLRFHTLTFIAAKGSLKLSAVLSEEITIAEGGLYREASLLQSIVGPARSQVLDAQQSRYLLVLRSKLVAKRQADHNGTEHSPRTRNRTR
jgi:hypothetical protein